MKRHAVAIIKSISSYITALFLLAAVFYTQAGNVFVVPSAANPSITSALSRARSGDTVIVDKGIYKEYLFLSPGVTIKARFLYKAVVDGNGRGTVVTMASNCSLEGLVIQNGTIGIYSSSAGNSIVKCKILSNSQSGILCIGSLPAIEDNIVAYNRGSGIQGWDLSSSKSTINHNTIAYNQNHGVAVGGATNIIAENNIIAYNVQFDIKTDGDAVKTALKNNDFFGNSAVAGTIPAENISVDPIFVDAPKMNFSLNGKSKCIGMATDRENIGTRVPSSNE